jgi:hypothetical protein
MAIYTICQSFLQVIASQAADPVVKQLTRNMLNNFDQQYHPTTDGEQSTREKFLWVVAIGILLFVLIFLRQLFSTFAHTIFKGRYWQ